MPNRTTLRVASECTAADALENNSENREFVSASTQVSKQRIKNSRFVEAFSFPLPYARSASVSISPDGILPSCHSQTSVTNSKYCRNSSSTISSLPRNGQSKSAHAPSTFCANSATRSGQDSSKTCSNLALKFSNGV